MHNRILINFILLFTVLFLAVFLWFTEKNDVIDIVKLTSIDPSSINRIKLTRQEQDEIIFIKNADAWSMQSPYLFPANNFRIETILGVLQTTSHTSFDLGSQTLDQFMLDPPAVTLELDDVQIEFGNTSPLGNQRYVKIKNVIHLINDGLFQQLNGPAPFFLDTKLIPAEKKIVAIEFPDYEIRHASGVWQKFPEMIEDTWLLQKVVNAWKTANATTVNKYHEQDHQGEIKIHFDNDEVINFKIISPHPNLILARSEPAIQYQLSSYESKNLFLSEEDETADTWLEMNGQTELPE